MQDVLYLPNKTEEPSPPHFTKNGGPRFSKPASSMKWPAFHFVDAETADVLLDSHPYLTHVPGDRLAALLDDATDAVEAIENGDADDILDVVLWTERQTEGRVSVLQAVGRRSDELDVVDVEDKSEQIDPSEITTA